MMSKISAVRSMINMIPPKIRGAAMISAARSVNTFGRVTWNSGMKYAFKPAAKTFSNSMHLMSTAKFAKAANILGIIDLAGSYLVESSVDDKWYSAIPGSGIIELGAAVINSVAKTDYMGAQFFWEAK